MLKRARYSPEYKREIVELVRRSQSSCRKIALEVGLNPNMLTRWVREGAAGRGMAFPGGGTSRDEEAARLTRIGRDQSDARGIRAWNHNSSTIRIQTSSP